MISLARFGRLRRSSNLAESALRAGLWGLAFWIGYHLQVRLEHHLIGWREFGYFVAAGLCIAVAAWPIRGEGEIDDSGSLIGTLRRREGWIALAAPLCVLGAAIVLGVFFRTHDLNSRPVGIWYDEAQNGLIARAILHGDYPPMFIGRDTQLPSAFFYLYALSAKVIGEGVLSLRVVSTIGGLAALPLVFLLGRELFGLRAGVLAAFLLAVMRWHVNFSRFGVTNIFAAFLVLGAVYFFVVGLRGKPRWNLVVSGVFVGLTPYAGFYGAFVPFVIGLYWLHAGVFARLLTYRRHFAALIIVALTAVAVYSPVAFWGLSHGDAYLSRPGTASILNGATHEQAYHAVLKSTRKHLLMFNSLGDANGRHNLPKAPMLDRFTGILFLLGVALAFLRIRRSGYFLLLAWVAVFLQNGIWSVAFEAPQAFRTSAVTPAVAMLAAIPLAALWDVAARGRVHDAASAGARAAYAGGQARYRRAQTWIVRGVATGGVVLLLGLIAYSNYDTYFNTQLNDPQVWRAFNSDIAVVANKMNDAESDHRILISSLFSSPVITYADPDAANLGSYQLDLTRDVPLAGGKQTLVLLDSTKQSDAEWIKTLYPDAKVTEIRPPGEAQTPAVFEIEVSAAAIANLQGVRALYARSDAEFVTRREPNISFDWAAQTPPLAFPFQAHWGGTMRFSDYKDHVLSVIAPGAITLLVDGQRVATGNGRVDFSSAPYRGLRAISIDAGIDGPGEIALLDQGKPVTPSDLFSGDAVDTRHGLLATFYHNTDFAGTPAFQQLDPFVGFRNHEELPFGSNFSAIWKGHLDAPAEGTYTFFLDAVDKGSLMIDGQQILDLTALSEKQVALTAGTHDIEVRMLNVGGYAELFLRWQRPDGTREIIPSGRLTP